MATSRRSSNPFGDGTNNNNPFEDETSNNNNNAFGNILSGFGMNKPKNANPFEEPDATNPFDDDDNDNNLNNSSNDVQPSPKIRQNTFQKKEENNFFQNLFQHDQQQLPQDAAALERLTRKQRRKARKKIPTAQRWPFDDYHEDQTKYYESLPPQAPSDSDESDDSMDVKKQLMDGSTKQSNAYHDRRGNTSSFYERPAPLVPIPTAVRANLVDFEKIAEERAITIVSTWIFDCGLIDELIHSGRRTSTVAAVSLQEGVEVTEKRVLEVVQQRFEKEMSKVRLATQRDLTLINTRLNEGVAATGAEVRELVDAVQLAKTDIYRLRQLATYITPSVTSDTENKYMLAPYPKLQKVTFARKNLTKCFREVDFFSQIPHTCERLREELHSGEYTATEWNTIRGVCMQHVELEICLVEAKAGLELLRVQEAEDKKLTRHMFRKDSRQENLMALEKFLSIYVSEVWEIGEEIKLRVTAGMSNVFNLAVSNPSGMVALVESIEVYERSIEQYKEKYGNEQTLAFTEIRSSALAELYDVFEKRGLYLFKDVHNSVAEDAEEEDSFRAVFSAANHLVAEILLVKQQMCLCFPKNWSVEILWTCVVANTCSNQILQQIGGPEGNNLPDLSVAQLLDVVSWIEQFRDVVEEIFPEVVNMRSTKKTYLHEKPDLFAGNAKEVNYENAMDSLAWSNNMLWEVHRLAQDQFLEEVREQADEWLSNAYIADHTGNITQEGLLTTSLCEDLFQVVIVEYNTIKEHLAHKSEGLALAVAVIFNHLNQKQKKYRDNFVEDLKSCCAAANDFNRMSEKCEDVLDQMTSQCEFSTEHMSILETASNELLSVYAYDAVFAAQSTHKYIFEPIQEVLGDAFFSREWEDNLINNEIASSLVKTLEDFMMDLVEYLDPLLWKKAVEALVSATVIFYIRCLLLKAENYKNNREAYFSDIETTLDRIRGDHLLLREYFEGLESRHPVLGRVIDREFELLSNVQECMDIAAGFSDSDAQDFVLVMNKRISDPFLTQHFFGDIWHLINPQEERGILEAVATMEDSLVAFSSASNVSSDLAQDIPNQPGIKFDQCLEELYLAGKRKLPGKKISSLKKSLNPSL